MDEDMKALIEEVKKRIPFPAGFDPEDPAQCVKLLKAHGLIYKAREDNDRLIIQWAIGPETTTVWMKDASKTMLQHVVASRPDPGEHTEKDDLNEKSVKELKELAKEAGISGYTSMKKETLIKALLDLSDEPFEE